MTIISLQLSSFLNATRGFFFLETLFFFVTRFDSVLFLSQILQPLPDTLVSIIWVVVMCHFVCVEVVCYCVNGLEIHKV